MSRGVREPNTVAAGVSPSWNDEMRDLIQRIRARTPADLDPNELATDVETAVAEVREVRRRAREAGAGD